MAITLRWSQILSSTEFARSNDKEQITRSEIYRSKDAVRKGQNR
jgi:hypothetical protein